MHPGERLYSANYIRPGWKPVDDDEDDGTVSIKPTFFHAFCKRVLRFAFS
jgi:hypothetical protein